jgi:hypothetical protein
MAMMVTAIIQTNINPRQSLHTMASNCIIYSRSKFWCNEFNVSTVKKHWPNVKRVIYSICSWHYHGLPDKDAFAREGIECTLQDLPHFDTDRHIEELQTQTYDIPTLIFVQTILPFQREAWGV